LCAALPPSLIPLQRHRLRVILATHPHEIKRQGQRSGFLAGLVMDSVHVVAKRRFRTRAELGVGPQERAFLLFPGQGSTDLTAADRRPIPCGVAAGGQAPASASAPTAIVLIDATWKYASEMLNASPALQALPCKSLPPRARVGVYIGRKQPTSSGAHVSTYEAVVDAICAVEPALAPSRPAMMRPLLLKAKHLHAFVTAPDARVIHRPGKKNYDPQLFEMFRRRDSGTGADAAAGAGGRAWWCLHPDCLVSLQHFTARAAVEAHAALAHV